MAASVCLAWPLLRTPRERWTRPGSTNGSRLDLHHRDDLLLAEVEIVSVLRVPLDRLDEMLLRVGRRLAGWSAELQSARAAHQLLHADHPLRAHVALPLELAGGCPAGGAGPSDSTCDRQVQARDSRRNVRGPRAGSRRASRG